MHFSVSGHVTLGVVRWRHELDYICPLWVLSKFGPIEAYMCRVIASWFFPSNGIKRYFNGPLNKPARPELNPQPSSPSLLWEFLPNTNSTANATTIHSLHFINKIQQVIFQNFVNANATTIHSLHFINKIQQVIFQHFVWRLLSKTYKHWGRGSGFFE